MILFCVISLLLGRRNVFVGAFLSELHYRQDQISKDRYRSTIWIKNDNEVPSLSDNKGDLVFVEKLKSSLLTLGESTDRGFQASSAQRKEAITLIERLSMYNPIPEPAFPYYDPPINLNGPSVCGKWTLVYTDSPDITSLSSSPFGKLGKIGQDCTNPPFVKNVIEWQRPDWAKLIPWSGGEESRILQKVSTKATASRNNPLHWTLDLVGIELVAPIADDKWSDQDWLTQLQTEGLPRTLLLQPRSPWVLQGPITVPFGAAKLLYVDEKFRILRTQQNFVAVNVRSNPEWF
jgi:PAP_fibrillin